MNLDFEQSLSIVVQFRASSETHKDKGAAPAYPQSTSLLRMITSGVKIVRHSTHWCHWWKSWFDSIKVDLGMHRAIAHWKAILFGNHSIKSLQRVAFPVHNGVFTSPCHGRKISGWHQRESEFTLFLLPRSYSFYLSNVGKVFWSWIRSKGPHLSWKENFCASLCSPTL